MIYYQVDMYSRLVDIVATQFLTRVFDKFTEKTKKIAKKQ
jgi:hypothetical protein